MHVGHELSCGAALATSVTALRKPRPRKACSARTRAAWLELWAHWCRAAPGVNAIAAGGHFGQIGGEDDAVRQVPELELPHPGEVAFGPGADAHRRPAALRQQKRAQVMFGAQLVSARARTRLRSASWASSGISDGATIMQSMVMLVSWRYRASAGRAGFVGDVQLDVWGTSRAINVRVADGSFGILP